MSDIECSTSMLWAFNLLLGLNPVIADLHVVNKLNQLRFKMLTPAARNLGLRRCTMELTIQ